MKESSQIQGVMVLKRQDLEILRSQDGIIIIDSFITLEIVIFFGSKIVELFVIDRFHFFSES